MKRSFIFLAIFTFCSIHSYAQDVQQARLLRFPAVYENQIIFSYAGDLYTVDKTGGIARKLTNDIGYEMFARFSPDGKSIAFTGQYDGNTEVYLMPSQGGVPERLTYTATIPRDDISDRMGPNNIVMTWTNDGENIIYRSRKQSFNSFVGQLFKVSKNGGLSKELPLPTGGFCSFSPDGNKLAYNRVFREFRTWKYYKGGMADDVWIYDFKTKKTTKITDNDNQNIFPMWKNDEIYFLSDRDRTMNMFVYNTKTKQTKKVTDFTKYDIKFPSLGKDAIVFENGGYIYLFDIKTKKYEKINIQIANDFANGRDQLKDAGKNINSVEISPDGKRIVVGARGDIFTVPVQHGITRNLTQSSGAHDRNAVWSPDGKYIAYISDKNGEYEIYIQKQDGTEPPVQLTKDADTYKYYLKWSPDSKKILWNDKMLRLQYVDIKTKKVTLIAKSKIWEFQYFNWAPDSKWLTYVSNEKNDMSKIHLYNIDSKKDYEVTQEWYSSSQPTFSNDGKYLLLTSKRDFNPIYSETEWNTAYRDMSKIYLITLAKSTLSPLAPENDEVKIESDTSKTKNDKKKKKQDIKQPVTVKIDIDGIQNRIVALPVKASNYWSIYGLEDKIYYCERSFSSKQTLIKVFDLKKKKETDLGNYDGFDISANKKKMLIKKGKKYSVIDLSGAKIKLDESVDLSNLKIPVNNKKEWKQIYDESWRQMRDFFYDPDMHKVDWKAMHDKYAVLVPYVNNRNDLNYIIGELIGELSIGHSYVSGGDKPTPKKIYTGLLGAKISRHSSGYYKIDKILKGENWNKNLRSPLTEIGVNVNQGDYIIAVNGKSTKNMDNIYESLINTADKQIEITVNSKPNEKDSRKTIIVPVKDQANLYYYKWVQNNIKKVSESTNNQVGYIHIPDMSTKGLNEFVKYFYPQLKKKALIIDDRGNGGGNVSPMLIERLRREITRSNIARNVTEPGNTPKQMMLGPKVLLINCYSASDGDLFPYSFKKHKIGKVIGTRTWGAVTGIRGSLPFVDGGSLYKPEFGTYSSDTSKWIIEGYGVDPDIIVVNDPAKEYAGEDQQLNKAIEVILEELKNYKGLPPVPAFPDKSK
jgi:tricorn protease